MGSLEKRVAKLEQSRPGINFAVLVIGDEDKEATIERACAENGVSREAWEAACAKTDRVVLIHLKLV